jgi:hypothetical protein
MTMKKNPVFWLMWLLPAAAVCASFATLAIALGGADTALPTSYHWEGERLDEDFERARRAVSLGVSARLDLRAGECIVTLRSSAGDSASLRLLLTHSNDVSLDRQVLLRLSQPGEFRAPCSDLPAGKWRIALDDEFAGWAIRAKVDGSLASVNLRARDPGGPAS